MKGSKKIHFVCIECGKKTSVSEQAMNKRKCHPGEHICVSCYHKISPGGPYGKEYYPKELQRIWLNKVWDYDVVKPYLNTLKTKKKIRFICEICGKEDIRSLNQMNKRKICGVRPICRKCALAFAVGSNEWAEANSKAQLEAQNRPEVLEKQRKAQMILMRNDPLYSEKRASRSYISGTINGMKFDSSWEMFYIAYCWENKNISSIMRYKGSIEYCNDNGVLSRYFPDFIVTFKNGTKKIVEIKGSRKYRSFHEKFNAAKKKWEANYVVYGQKEMYKMGITFRRKPYILNFINKNYKITFNHNKKTNAFMEQIDKWLK